MGTTMELWAKAPAGYHQVDPLCFVLSSAHIIPWKLVKKETIVPQALNRYKTVPGIVGDEWIKFKNAISSQRYNLLTTLMGRTFLSDKNVEK